MTNKNPHLFIIGGPNGAGKTTSAMKLLPNFLQCEEYVNADGIASGLSQFRPESVAIKAGRAMLSRIQELTIYDNSYAKPELIAKKIIGNKIEIINEFAWLKIQEESK